MQGLHLTPDNLRYWASFLHSSADIQSRVIYFGPGVKNETLIEVPLGGVDPRSTIIVTFGLDKYHLNTPGEDTDLRVGISDGFVFNQIALHDVNNYGNLPPCDIMNALQDDLVLPSSVQAPATFKLTFVPFYKSVVCETAQKGGYINTGTYIDQIDTTKPLFLRADRRHANEEYFIHYIRVEIF